MALYPIRALIVIPASKVDLANSLAMEFDYDELCQCTFTVGLSVSGTNPASFYWCSTQLNSEIYNELVLLNQSQFLDGYIFEYNLNNPTFPQQVLNDLSLIRIET